MIIEGSWDKNTKPFKLIDSHMVGTKVNVGSGVWYSKRGVEAIAMGGTFKFFMHYTLPGMHSIFYSVINNKIFFAERKSRVRDLIGDQVSTNTKISRLQSGVLLVFNGSILKKYKGESYTPPIVKKLSLKKAGAQFKNLLLETADDIYTSLGKPRVASMLSAGTDSTLTTWALKEIGANVSSYCVGTSENDFDPRWAKVYAKELKVPYTFVKLPESEEQRQKLLVDTLSLIQQYDYSNVLMALCTNCLRLKVKNDGISILFHGHFADDLLGNSNLTYGGYKKQCEREDVHISSEGWRDYRIKCCMHGIPNNWQVANVCRTEGMDWRSLFYSPKIIDFVLAMPLNIAPLKMEKLLYWEALKGIITDCAWYDHKKVGYYSGSGIGTIRMEKGVWGDINIKNVYKQVQKVKII